MEWIDGDRIKVTPPKNPLKLTGTRFAAVLGMNAWSTPFKVWCEVTRTYKEPFVDTIYTRAGKIIEPKQAEYIKAEYFWETLCTPTDIFGKDYFKKTHGDFFPDEKIFGGMWDYLFIKKGGAKTVLEMKTTKRAEDWKDDIPEYYALQAALYAYLLGIDDVMMVASFLDDNDYDDPDKFECDPDNTITRPFKLSERYPDFEKTHVKPALKWWKDHVVTGISPAFDEKTDADVLKALRTNNLSPETDIAELVKEAEELKAKLDANAAEIEEDKKRYAVVTDVLKEAIVKQFRDGDKNVTVTGSRFLWDCRKSQRTNTDTAALKKDGLYEKYVSTTDTYTLTPKEIIEEDAK